MPDKPSKTEDEYFAKESAELIKKRRSEAERAADEAERKSHYMRCPKCGGHLAIEDYQGVEIDRCKDCSGIWLDPGEMETLVAREDASVISIFRSVMKGVK
jgi:hypothetical protein